MNATQLKTYNTDTFDFNDFEYILEDYEDTESTSLAVESESVMTDSVMADKSDFDIELKTFLFNDTSFNQARELAEAEEETDINILLENNDTDIDIESCNIASSLAADLESENNENEYLVQGNIDTNMKLSQQLSACPILDIIDAFFDTKSFPVTTKSPSLLFVKIVLRLGHINMMNIIDQKYDITPETAPALEKALGIATWNARYEVRNKKMNLESPSSLAVYQDGFPLCVANFFNGFIETLQRKKHEVLQHERILEKTRRHEAKPETRLLRSAYIWNVLVIDNIDFIEKTFAYGNIYDVARRTAHATLRMVFQFILPMQLRCRNHINVSNPREINQSLFGTSTFTSNLLKVYETTFQNFLTTGDENWDVSSILSKISENVPIGCQKKEPYYHEKKLCGNWQMNYLIFACYDLGTARLYKILQQDVYKIEPKNTVGRRKRNVVVHKLISQAEHQRKETQERGQTDNNSIHINQAENSNVATGQLHEQTGAKRQRRATSNYEKNILDELLKYDTFPEEKAVEILRNIQEQSNDWDMQRVRIYWNNNRHNKRKKVSSDM
ncbi:10631_t:CDS:2 [Dentiscutata erythropus]|uniref:10631_t:CDS:1 n=1 Tax=Dentiscutata erythropus TaxID=1348616 RepID=A0A9N9DCM9_9GLOM|nr:10631_t:CDS:2 [Dentiscutata erythropus]